MKKYAKIIDVNSWVVEVGTGDPEAVYQIVRDPNTGDEKRLLVRDFYQSIGLSLMDVEQGYDGIWYVAGKAPAVSENVIIQQYEDAVQAHLDNVAQSRGYDNTYTCLSYLQSSDEIWRNESNIFNIWRDQVWRKCHEVLNAVKAGSLTPPTVTELIATLPPIEW